MIALADIGLLDRCEGLFVSCLVPPAVAREIAPSIGTLSWAIVQGPSRPIDARTLYADLGAGETDALALALEINPDRILLDDRQARRLGASFGLPIIGTAGILLDAKHAGLVPAVKPSLDALLQVGFFISMPVLEQILADAGEEALADAADES